MSAWWNTLKKPTQCKHFPYKQKKKALQFPHFADKCSEQGEPERKLPEKCRLGPKIVKKWEKEKNA